MLLIFFYVLLALFIILYCILYHLVKVKIGTPPFGVLFIFYKYSLFNRQNNFKFLHNSGFSIRSHKLIKLFYFSRIENRIESAEGVILSEDGGLPDGDSYKEAQRASLSIFTTPAISHAMSIEFRNYLGFPLTKLFAILIGYPRIHRLSKKKNLCAYPIIEIYTTKSITIVVPLMQQDSFVVPEAESVVHGKSYYDEDDFSMYKNIVLKRFDELMYQKYFNKSKDLKSPKAHKRITKG